MRARSVLFVTDRGGAQEHARCRLPAQALARAGWRVAFTSGMVRPPRRDPRLWHPELGSPDVVVLRMVADPRVPELIGEARAAGQVIVSDIDDLLWDIPEWSEVHAFAGRAEQIERLEAVLAASDLVTCSTPPLAAAVEEHVAGARATVVRNGIDVAAFRPHIYDHVPLRVAYPGLLSFRSGDLATIAAPLVESLNHRGPAVQLWHLGHRPDAPDICDLLPGLTCEVIRQPWVTIRDLPAIYEQIDCAVVPVADVPFNRSRSAFTGLGLAAAGISFVSSDLPEYQALADLGVGFAVPATEWRWALDMLLDWRDWRRTAGAAGRETVAHAHGLRRVARDWADAFSLAAEKVTMRS